MKLSYGDSFRWVRSSTKDSQPIVAAESTVRTTMSSILFPGFISRTINEQPVWDMGKG